MKKNIFIICVMLFVQKICTNEGLLCEALYYENQGNIKYRVYTRDGIGFSSLENSIRRKYKDLNIPPIIVAESLTLVLTNEPLEIGCCYFCGVNYIVLQKDTIYNFTAKECEWMILHEAGHAQKQFQNNAIGTALVAIPLLVAYYWGAHRTKPYKNIATKLLSKACAATIAGILVGSELIKAEEKRADSWANEHGDEEALLGGINALNRCKGIIQDKLAHTENVAILNKIPFSILEWIYCPYHPSVDSRIAKIKRALKKRFPHTEIDSNA